MVKGGSPYPADMIRNKSLLALVLLLPVPSLGVWVGMILIPDHWIGKGLFFCAKAWLLLLPLLWRVRVERRTLSWSRPTEGGFAVATAIGLGIAAIICAVYLTLGPRLIDPATVQAMGASTRLNEPLFYGVGALYWITVNSVLEEYVWRWFVVEKFQDLFSSRTAILASALGFTLHHVVAMQHFLSGFVTIIAATGIFIGGAIWSWCYVRYRSIWPGYLSHALVDIAIFGIGYHLMFCGPLN